MPWKCPKCGRPFKHKNQSHNCVAVSVETHLSKLPEHLVKAYKKLENAVKAISNDVTVSPAINAILFTCNGTFMAVKFKKETMVLEFFLPQAHNEFPVFKTMRYSKTKIVHFVAIEHEKEVDKPLLG